VQKVAELEPENDGHVAFGKASQSILIGSLIYNSASHFLIFWLLFAGHDD